MRGNNYRKRTSGKRWGILGKQKEYIVESFKERPDLTEEERRRELLDKVKPYSYDPSKHEVITMAHGKVDSGPAPTPTPADVIITLSPTGATQYENVDITASTTGSNPTFIWTLTDFYNTGDTQVTSYTGSSLPSGYFTSTGSSNVTVTVSADEGTGSTSTFLVSEFDALSTSPDWWYDTSDISSITFRTGTNYIEQIDDKSGNNRHVIQTTAAYQPLYSASSVNGSLSAATFNGIDERMDYIGSAVLSISGHTTMGVGQNKDKALQPGNPGGAGLGSPFYRFYNPSTSGNNRYLSNTSAEWVFNRNYVNDRKDTRTNVDGGAEEVIWYRRENNTGTIDDAVINGHSFPSTSATYYPYDGGSVYFGWYVLTADYQLKLWGEIGEMLHYHRTISDTQQTQLDRYLNYKWFNFTPTISGSSSVVQYEDVSYSAEGVKGYNKSYNWTMPADWVGDTTGQTITGYFSGTTGGNIELEATGGIITKTASPLSVSVSSFSPDSVSGLVTWYDLSDISTITLRTGTDYIEQIDDKSTNGYHLSQTTATNQPLYSASSINSSLSAATFDGIDNWITADKGTTDTISSQSYFVMSRAKDKVGIPGVGTGNQLDGKVLILGDNLSSYDNNDPYISRDAGGTAYYLKSFGDVYNNSVTNFDTDIMLSIMTNTNDGLGITNYSVNSNITGWTETIGGNNYDWRYTRLGGNLHNTSNYVQKLLGEVNEVLIYDTDLPISNINSIDRYLQYKWFGYKQY